MELSFDLSTSYLTDSPDIDDFTFFVPLTQRFYIDIWNDISYDKILKVKFDVEFVCVLAHFYPADPVPSLSVTIDPSAVE